MSFTSFIYRPAGFSDQEWQTLGSLVKDEFEQITPVRTGHMQASYTDPVVGQREMRISNLADYAQYVENGNTRGMSPRDLTGQVQAKINSMAGR